MFSRTCAVLLCPGSLSVHWLVTAECPHPRTTCGQLAGNASRGKISRKLSPPRSAAEQLTHSRNYCSLVMVGARTRVAWGAGRGAGQPLRQLCKSFTRAKNSCAEFSESFAKVWFRQAAVRRVQLCGAGRGSTARGWPGPALLQPRHQDPAHSRRSARRAPLLGLLGEDMTMTRYMTV